MGVTPPSLGWLNLKGRPLLIPSLDRLSGEWLQCKECSPAFETEVPVLPICSLPYSLQRRLVMVSNEGHSSCGCPRRMFLSVKGSAGWGRCGSEDRTSWYRGWGGGLLHEDATINNTVAALEQ